MPRQYNTQGYIDDPLAQGNSSSYQWNGFAGLADDIFGGFIFGDYDWSSYIMGELLGHNSQQREFEQQEYLMKYDDPAYKMARAKAAGINPNLAAQQIAGSGNSVSAPAVASNTQGVANGLGAASNAIGSISQANLNSSAAKANNAKAALDFATARNSDRLADAEILSKAGSFAQALTSAGTPEIAAMELALSTVRGGLDGIAAILKGDSVCRMIDTQQQLIEAEYSRQWKEIERLEKDIEFQGLRISEQDYKNQIAEIEKKKADLQLWREQQINDLWVRFDGDPYLSEFQLMANIRLKYGEDSPQYQGILKQAKDMMYNQSVGAYTAESETAFERFRNKVQGEDTGKRVNAKFFADLDNYRGLFDTLSKLYFSSDGSLQGLAHRIISLLGSELGLSTEEIEQMFQDAQNPNK